ncbi:hypothetical protein AYI69_g10344 [Smittium culicis]|uniref:Beta/gamma crystallin 'Greek key' domain-containing protein n=1 Tax=Smittium culicis TaxID=133412 RepID=A0A1R1X6D9_9FUNG|nr:hypothetical protein AYI69_g10344 [Smittium culicis]
MLKSGILIIFASMCLNGAYSQSAGNAEINYSFNPNFSENYRLTQKLGTCRGFGSFNAIRVKTLEDSELMIYNGYNCNNLVARRDVCGTFTEKNLRSTFGIGHFSVMVLPKSNACKYPKRKRNDDCD